MSGAAIPQAFPASARSGESMRFLCVGTDWDGHPSSLALLFRAIATDHDVVWVNSIGLRAPRLTLYDFKRLMRKGARALLRLDSRPSGMRAVIEPRVLPFHGYQAVRALNGWLLERQIRPQLARGSGPLVFVTSNPAAVSLIRHINVDLTLYYCMDEYAEMADCDADMIRRCEPLMLQAADGTFATSIDLCRRKSVGGRGALHLPHGVDFEHFQGHHDCPRPLQNLSRPIIGFHGVVGARLDFVLLEKILRAFPRASIVMVGRRERDLSRLEAYTNFHHFDAVPYTELPAWVAQFDIGLVAYRRDGHTDAVNPLKLLEYLAAGLPVVSVALPELVQHSRFVSLAGSHDEYLQALASWVRGYPFAEQERSVRRAYAASASWQRRAEQFLQTCETLLTRRAQKAGLLAVRGGSRCR